MDTRFAERIEGITRIGAAAILAVAVAFALSKLAASVVTIGAAAVAVLFVAPQILRSIGSVEHDFPIAPFEPSQLIVEEWDELLLTEVARSDHDFGKELLLEDVLAELGDESRVVRLFDVPAMTTPGELKRRIDLHLDRAHSQVPADASEALHDALAELRRSLT